MTDWLSDAVFYEIYPQSFADSDGDGIGDLPGALSHLDHLAWLGVDAVWFNPCFASPVKDDPDFAETATLWAGISDWMHGAYPEAILLPESENGPRPTSACAAASTPCRRSTTATRSGCATWPDCRTRKAASTTRRTTAAAAAARCLPQDPDRPTVAARRDDPGSTLNRVRLLLLRRNTPALRTAAPTTGLARGYPLVYLRGTDHLVVINPRREPVSVVVAELAGQEVVALEADGAEVKDGTVQADGFGYGVFRLEPAVTP